jgi:hypothetical protein
MAIGQHGEWIGELTTHITFWGLVKLLEDAAETMQPSQLTQHKIQLLESSVETMKRRHRLHGCKD